jgi:hypothetical protein
VEKLEFQGTLRHVSKGEVEQAGFVKVEERALKVPVGTWPKDKRLVTSPNICKIPRQ